jgi:pyridoxamine 5'-phosphate oxidase family protein
LQPWVVRGVETPGEAEALTDQDPPAAYYSREVIRIRPVKIISWS